MKQMRISSEKISKLLQSVPKIISEIENDNLREQIEHMFNDGNMFERFCSAPASHRANYHNCMPCGLLDHTLRVYSVAKTLFDMIPTESVTHDDIIVCSLLHDLGKVGDPDGEDYYLPQDSTWHQEKLGEFYKINDNLNYMTHAQRSLFWCQEYEIPLSQAQYKGILLHDGMYVEENRVYAHKEGLLTTIIHSADNLATNIERDKYNKFVGK